MAPSRIPTLRALRRAFRAAPAALLLATYAPGLPAQSADNVARSSASSTAVPALASRIDSILDRPALRRARWGIEVRDAGTGRLLYARDAARPVVPASNLKLVVTAAAAHHLPAGYRWRTTVHAAGEVRDGTLEGDLVLAGRGDPLVSARYGRGRTAVFEALADSLLARGVRRVSGGVVADQSYFDTAYVHPDWDPYDLRWWYAAPVSALGFNDNAIDFRIQPGAAVGRPARITWAPESEYVRLVNATTTARRGAANTLDLERLPDGRIRAYGQIALGAITTTEFFAVDHPARWTGTVFREVLERKGIAVGRREVRVVSDPSASVAGSAPVLAEHASEPLERVIQPILKSSQNWFAEQLAKTLGKELRGEGSWAAGLEVERRFLIDVVGADSADFVLRDASGLSDENRITPRALVALLRHVERTPRQAAVRRQLPVSGGEGSLEARFADLPGRVHAKTGYIGGVDSLSGFVRMRDGRWAVFAIVANQEGGSSGRMKNGIDDVVRAIAAGAR